MPHHHPMPAHPIWMVSSTCDPCIRTSPSVQETMPTNTCILLLIAQERTAAKGFGEAIRCHACSGCAQGAWKGLTVRQVSKASHRLLLRNNVISSLSRFLSQRLSRTVVTVCPGLLKPHRWQRCTARVSLPVSICNTRRFRPAAHAARVGPAFSGLCAFVFFHLHR